jgi:ribosomal-protein-alanine N-acetyltransferase
MEIEQLCFTAPWPRDVFAAELEREGSYIKVMAAAPTDQVVAFINYWVVHDEIHILNVATHPDWRRQNLARRLITHTRRGAQIRGARLMILEVRRSNSGAINLYTEMGFSPIGVRPKYYENNEDAIVMTLQLLPPA